MRVASRLSTATHDFMTLVVNYRRRQTRPARSKVIYPTHGEARGEAISYDPSHNLAGNNGGGQVKCVCFALPFLSVSRGNSLSTCLPNSRANFSTETIVVADGWR